MPEGNPNYTVKLIEEKKYIYKTIKFNEAEF